MNLTSYGVVSPFRPSPTILMKIRETGVKTVKVTKCLRNSELYKAKESINILVTICQSDNEELNKVASETLMYLGEDGRQAYEILQRAPAAGNGRPASECLETVPLDTEDGKQAHECPRRAATEGEDDCLGHECAEKADLEGDGRQAHECPEEVSSIGEDVMWVHEGLQNAGPKGEDGEQAHECLDKVTLETEDGKQHNECLGETTPEVATIAEHTVPATAILLFSVR
ncbi:unnamed protein product [Ranitomeya imitator]|uniref:Uncharacterized protein n=1 Tax=Ranitomeya imitator TaxID=111125 RepID=A0ABN9LNY7_9NEOB|nr:unnamed protein product [Ranitomeya imitator]